MKSKMLLFLLFVLLLLWCSLALAQEKASGIPDVKEQKVEVKIDKSKISPEFRKILETEESAFLRIKTLNERMKGLDGNQIAELQKEVEKIKKDADIEIQKIRLGIAKEKNDTKSIREIEKAQEQLERPAMTIEDQESKAIRETWEKENNERREK
jgi:TolA-binding protein